jgi:hypothetical protein
MVVTHNVEIPLTIQRLGNADVEDLIITGLERPISRDDVHWLLERRYPNRRRAARAVLRIVTDEDLDTFNDELDMLRASGVTRRTKFTMRTSYARGICTIRVLGG